jgi:parallel beta-helix repeat protein
MHLVDRCKIGQVGTGINAFFTCTLMNNSISAATAGQGTGIYSYTECRIEGNHIYGFDAGIYSGSGQSNVVTANVMTTCTHPITGSGSPMVAPVVTTAAALAANPTANIAQ